MNVSKHCINSDKNTHRFTHLNLYFKKNKQTDEFRIWRHFPHGKRIEFFVNFRTKFHHQALCSTSIDVKLNFTSIEPKIKTNLLIFKEKIITVEIRNWRHFPRGERIEFFVDFMIELHYQALYCTSIDVKFNFTSNDPIFKANLSIFNKKLIKVTYFPTLHLGVPIFCYFKAFYSFN